MTDETILNPEGLAKMARNRRVAVHREFVNRSQVVFYYGNIIGYIFTVPAFYDFLKLPVIKNAGAGKMMFDTFARAWGAAGHKVFPVEIMDDLLDVLSGTVDASKISQAELNFKMTRNKNAEKK